MEIEISLWSLLLKFGQKNKILEAHMRSSGVVDFEKNQKILFLLFSRRFKT